MKRFLVISHHTGEDCVKALKETLAIGYLTHFDWGCKDGVHKAWFIADVANQYKVDQTPESAGYFPRRPRRGFTFAVGAGGNQCGSGGAA